MQKLMAFIGILFLLASCGSDDTETTTQTPTQTERPTQAWWAAPWGERNTGAQNEFSIETTQVSDFQNNYSIQKIWQILPNSSHIH